MTIAIAVLSSDGLVVAGDSRTTYTPSGTLRVLSDFTHKVFDVHQIGVVTYGWAFIQNQHVAGHFSEFRSQVDGSRKLTEIADDLKNFMGDRLDAHIEAGLDKAQPSGVDVLGFLLAGYEDGESKILEVTLPSRKVSQPVQPPGGAAWRGQTDPIVRLLKGCDANLLGAAAEKDSKSEHFKELLETIPKLEYLVPFALMHLQDAVDFALFAIRTTIDTQRLTSGTVFQGAAWPGVGGPIEIGVIRRESGFTWIQQTAIQGERAAGHASAGSGSDRLVR
jgi:hypothetical protein